MRFKPGVVIVGMDWRVHRQLRNGSALDRVFQRHAGRDCIITSGRDGKHHGQSYMDGSGHYRGESLDLRTNDMNARQIEQVASDLRAELGDEWFVLVESNHIHIGFDPEHRYGR